MNKKYQVLRCGRLYDGVTQEWKSGQSILVEDHLIAEVDSEVSVPEATEISARALPEIRCYPRSFSRNA